IECDERVTFAEALAFLETHSDGARDDLGRDRRLIGRTHHAADRQRRPAVATEPGTVGKRQTRGRYNRQRRDADREAGQARLSHANRAAAHCCTCSATRETAGGVMASGMVAGGVMAGRSPRDSSGSRSFGSCWATGSWDDGGGEPGAAGTSLPRNALASASTG